MEIRNTPPAIGATLGALEEIDKPAKPQSAPTPKPDVTSVDAPAETGRNKNVERAIQVAAAKAFVGAKAPAMVQTPYSHKEGPAGAYYRKVEFPPSADARGIEAKVVLPQPHFDTGAARWRMEVKDAPWKEGPCDRPSVYLGGNSGNREVDAGLTWDRVYTPDGGPTWTTDPNGWSRDQNNIFTRDEKGDFVSVGNGQPATPEQLKSLKPNCAFRPYVRTTNVQQSDLKGLSDEDKEAKKGQDWHSPQRFPSQTDSPANVYFFPGDRVTMKFGLRPTSKDDNRNIELSIGTEDGTNRTYTGTYRQENWPGDKMSFKRVNSLDQVGGEKNKQVMKTKTTLTGCRWESVSVKNKDGGSVALTPKNGREIRGGDTAQNYKDIFKFRSGSFNDRGSEYVDINPAAKR